MFDTEKSDRLTRNEFQAMVEATIGLRLRYLLATEEGAKVFDETLKNEFSEENLYFYQQVQAYTEAHEDTRLEMASQMSEKYVAEGAPEQVNLPGGVAKAIERQLDVARKGKAIPPADLFDVASQEIYRLMERDTFNRFRQQPALISKLVEEFFASADKNNTGMITFQQYRSWVKDNPTVLSFFSDVSKAASGMLANRLEMERRNANK